MEVLATAEDQFRRAGYHQERESAGVENRAAETIGGAACDPQRRASSYQQADAVAWDAHVRCAAGGRVLHSAGAGAGWGAVVSGRGARSGGGGCAEGSVSEASGRAAANRTLNNVIHGDRAVQEWRPGTGRRAVQAVRADAAGRR